MVLETGIPNLWLWLVGTETETGAIVAWSLTMLALFLSAFLLSWLVSIIFRGPSKGTRVVFGRFWDATRDLVRISPRRVISLTILCFREAIRRWAWVAFVIYLILLAFAGFFLDPKTNEPAQLYMDFVMSSAAFLVALIVLFLSVFSIPNDIYRRTIYTVVTKPVHASEIILGRIFGFSAMATLLLLGMCIASYLFVNRAIDHVHELDPTKLNWETVQDEDGVYPALVGRTEYTNEHRHDSRILLKNLGGQWQENATAIMHGHNHGVDAEFTSYPISSYASSEAGYDLTIENHALKPDDKILISPAQPSADGGGSAAYDYDEAGFTVTEINGDVVTVRGAEGRSLSAQTEASGNLMAHKVELSLTSPQGLLTARVPVYSSDFYFVDSTGLLKRAGVNVGNVWEYRSYVEGGSLLASVVWVFDGVTAENYSIDDYPSGLPVEFTLSIFRTHKGNIEEGVLGSLAVVNPETGRRSQSTNFVAKEFTINSQEIPRIIESPPVGGGVPERLDLFEDFIYDGDKLMVELKCLERGQYFGVARPDLYIAAADASFAFNYVKGFFSLYMQVLILTSFGVMFSTFLNGALSLISTFIIGIAGLLSDMIRELIGPQKPPGGLLFESMYRMFTRAPLTTDLEPGLLTSVALAGDEVVRAFLLMTYRIFPDLMKIWDKDYVANGFNIPSDLLGIQILTTLGFFIPLFVLSHFILKCREVAK